jgi:hypothetical protein
VGVGKDRGDGAVLVEVVVRWRELRAVFSCFRLEAGGFDVGFTCFREFRIN